jgi:hypothetical protein
MKKKITQLNVPVIRIINIEFLSSLAIIIIAFFILIKIFIINYKYLFALSNKKPIKKFFKYIINCYVFIAIFAFYLITFRYYFFSLFSFLSKTFNKNYKLFYLNFLKAK